MANPRDWAEAPVCPGPGRIARSGPGQAVFEPGPFAFRLGRTSLDRDIVLFVDRVAVDTPDELVVSPGRHQRHATGELSLEPREDVLVVVSRDGVGQSVQPGGRIIVVEI